MQYPVVALGGTFDHFHAGHETFLRFAADHGQRLIIGITDEHLTTSKIWSTTIESLADRVAAVTQFCHQLQVPTDIVILHDIYGPTLTNEVTALCVTEETLPGAELINTARQSHHLAPLPVLICPMAQDTYGQNIHSDRIRSGEIDRTGFSYHHLLDQTIQLTQAQRRFFSRPQGNLIDLNRPPQASQGLTIVVGDTSLETFLQNHWSYDIGIFDLVRQRQEQPSLLLEQLPQQSTVQNPAGVISTDLTTQLRRLTRTKPVSPHHLYVVGEEDLAAVAAVLVAPLGSAVYYGQPQQGIICIAVTETAKHLIRQQFTDGNSSAPE